MNIDADDLLAACLQLSDICVKNGGDLFLVEIASREFMDYLVDTQGARTEPRCQEYDPPGHPELLRSRGSRI
jgi:hypothetical protein